MISRWTRFPNEPDGLDLPVGPMAKPDGCPMAFNQPVGARVEKRIRARAEREVRARIKKIRARKRRAVPVQCLRRFFHLHAQPLSHPAGMARLQVWSLVGRWHSQCGVSGPKIDSRTPTNVNHQYLTVYSRLSGMVVDICRGLFLCVRLNPEAIKSREAAQ